MNSAEKFKPLRLKRLHPDADAVHAGIVVAEEFVAVDGAWIGFQRNLAVEVDGKRRGDPGKEFADARRLKSRWCAAAEEYTLHGPAAPILQLAVMLQLLQERVGIIYFRNFRHD